VAVKKVLEQGLSYSEVVHDLGIRDGLTHNWRKAFEVDGTLQAERFKKKRRPSLPKKTAKA
jgi:transposase-like protein